MSAPGDGPQYNPYGRPGSFRAGQEPGQYSSSPLSGQGYQQPYPAQGPGSYGGYNPYGGATPAGFGKEPEPPARRPGLMVLALVLMLLAALPFALGGLVGVFAPIDASAIPPGLLDNPQMVRAGATPDLLIQAIRLVSGIVVVVALVWSVLAVVAFRGRNWARIVLTVLTTGFVLLLAAGLVGGTTTGGLIGFVLGVALVMIGSIVILYLPDSSRFFTRRR